MMNSFLIDWDRKTTTCLQFLTRGPAEEGLGCLGVIGAGRVVWECFLPSERCLFLLLFWEEEGPGCVTLERGTLGAALRGRSLLNIEKWGGSSAEEASLSSWYPSSSESEMRNLTVRWCQRGSAEFRLWLRGRGAHISRLLWLALWLSWGLLIISQ